MERILLFIFSIYLHITQNFRRLRPSKLLLVCAFVSISFFAHAQNVLLIWDTDYSGRNELKTALEAKGFAVTLSDVSETEYDGTNPALTNFDVVIHLNGDTYYTPMPVAGQLALVNFVRAGGSYIGSEMNFYESYTMTTMQDLLLMESSLRYDPLVFTVVAGKEHHKILKNLPDPLNLPAGYFNGGNVKTYGTNPVDVLMRNQNGDASVMTRKLNLGKVINFNFTNLSSNILHDANAQQLYANAISWTIRENALNLDGVNDYMVAANAPVNLQTSSFTIETYIKTTSINAGIAGYADDNNTWDLGEKSFYLNGSGQPTFVGHSNQFINSNVAVNDNKWHHIAVVWNETTATGKIYVDGVETTAASDYQSHTADRGTLVIGAPNTTESTNYLAGSLDEFRFWSIARTAAEIEEGRKNEVDKNSAGLQVYYQFNQGVEGNANASANVLKDATANANHATLTNFALAGTTSNWIGSYAMVLPVAVEATIISDYGFTANWTPPLNGSADAYQLDVATDASFTNILPNYNGLTVTGTSYGVSGLNKGNTYYYRISAYNNTLAQAGANSNSISVLVNGTPPGNALAFDGNDDFVQVPTTATITGSYTVGAWIRPATLNAMAIFGTRTNNGDAFDIQLMGGNKIHGDIGNGAVFLNQAADGDFNYRVGEWFHIAYAVTPTGYTIYANGNIVGSGTLNGTPLLFNSGEFFQIGGNDIDPNFQGSMDELRIYSAALTANEIKADMLSLSPVVPANLVAHYNFDEGAPLGNNTGLSTLANLNPGFTGTLTNFALTGGASNWVSSYVMVVPTATAATLSTSTSFIANWDASTFGVTNEYRLDVATDAMFSNFVATYNLRSITSGTSYLVNNLKPNTTYYYKVSAYNTILNQTGASSNIVSATTGAAMAAPGNALQFDVNVDNYVSLPSNPIANLTSFTYETWFNFEGAWNMPRLFDFNNGAGNNVLMGIPDGSKKPTFYIQQNGTSNSIETTNAITLNSWNHVAITVSNNVWTLYLNGVQEAQTTNNTLTPVSVGATVNNWLGKSAYYNDPYFNGAMDQVRIWDHARTATEIAANYLLENPVATTGLLAYYNFDHGVAGINNEGVVTLYDQSAQHLDATLVDFKLEAGRTSNWMRSNAMAALPVAIAATEVTTNTFTANWTAPVSGSVDGYLLDVATDANFINLIPDYNGRSVGNVTSEIVNVGANATFYYRVRAYNDNLSGTTSNSNAISATTEALSPPGNALSFFSGWGSRVNVNSNAYPTGNSSYTIEAWVNPKSIANNGGILNWGNYSTNEATAIRFNGNAGNYSLHHYWWGDDLNVPIPDITNKWSHITATYDANTNIRAVYLNGELMGSDSPTGTHNMQSTNITIGQTYGSEYFSGKMDEVRIFNTARTLEEIKADMKNSIDPATPGLVAAYNFDQGIAGGNNGGTDKLIDQTTNAANGQLNGFSLYSEELGNWVKSFAMMNTVATAATLPTKTSFVANWTAPEFGVVDGYRLDVATDADFNNIIGNYYGYEVDGTTQLVENINPGTTYYYRVRGYINNDESGNSNTISVATTAVPAPGSALEAPHLYYGAQVNNSTPFNFGTGDFTLSAYIKTSDSDDYAQLIFGNLGNGDYWFGKQGNHLVFSANGSPLSGAKIISDSKWHHVAVTRIAGVISIYVDGALDVAENNTTDLSPNGYFTIGNFSNQDPYGFLGSIDEVRIFNEGLTEVQLQADLLSTTPVLTANLIAHYNFDQNAIGADNGINVFFDQSANANHGTLVNPLFSSSYALIVPAAVTTSLVKATGFTASWTAPVLDVVDHYRLDVATDAAFANLVTDYTDKNVGNVTTIAVTGLPSGTTYYYRLRAYNAARNVQGANSLTQTVVLPSDDATLSALNVSEGTLDPDFDPAELTYLALVPPSISSVTITPTVAQANATLTINGTALASGTTSESYSLTTGKNIFNIVVTAEDGTTIKDYELNVQRGKIAQTITLASTASATYGGADINPAATSSHTDYTNYPITYTTSDASIASIVNNKVKLLKAGVVTITATQEGDATYAVGTVSQTLTIGKKSVGVIADAKTRLQGAANPTFTASYDGFINGDTQTVLTQQPTFVSTATTASLPGNYTITPSNATAANYSFTYSTGTLTVVAATVTNISLAATNLYENSAVGTAGGTLSSTSNDPLATYTYTLVSGTGADDNSKFSIVGNEIRTSAVLNFETQAIYTVRVKTTTQYGVVFEKALTINLLDVNEAPTLAAIANQTFCSTTAVQSIALSGISAGPETAQTTSITATSNNPALFQNLAASNTGATGTVTYNLRNNAVGTAIVTVTITDNGGTANGGVNTTTRTFTVTSNALPAVEIVSDRGVEVSKGETLKLTASGGTTYTWAANNSIISGQNTATLTVRPSVTTTYTVTVGNTNQCTSVKTITITVVEDFAKVKTADLLTPNGDGFNDKWIIENIDLYPNNVVSVFDKAGRLLFSKKTYDNSWDGTYNGVPLKEDTYYYIIDFGPSFRKIKGFITIVKNN